VKNTEKILHTARHLFNERGLVYVRLQHISDDATIPVDDPAFPYQNKGAIIEAIFAQWEAQLKGLMIKYQQIPTLENIDRIFTGIESIQEDYSFFFTDMVEIKRAFPGIFEQIQGFLHWQVLQFEEILRFNVSRAALIELDKNDISFLATLLLEHMNTWSSRSLMWNKVGRAPSEKNLSNFCWTLLVPYMTSLGLEELEVILQEKIRL